MSFSAGVFSINSAGQPVTTNTVISSTAFNSLTADLATGLSTCVLKDGTQTMTAALPMGNFRITGLGVPTTALDAAIYAQPITNSLSGDVALNNTANYFDGPSVAQGTSGTWLAMGTVTVTDTAGSATYYVKLWDGTTVISSAVLTVVNASNTGCIAISGRIASPAGNIRISVRDTSSTSGSIIFNSTGLSKDSTLTAIRIG